MLILALMLPVKADAQWGHNPNCTGVVPCTYCGGYGVIPCGYSYMQCTFCGGSGAMRCAYCAGKKAAEEILKDKRNGYNNAPSGGYNNNNSNYNSSSNGRTCRGCNGTGRCTGCINSKYPGKTLTRNIYTAGPDYYSDCPVCGGNAKCKVCFGKGVIN